MRFIYSNKQKNLLSLYDDIINHKAKIAVYGLGQVGSSIAAVWLRKGAYVIGIDKSEHIIEQANQGFTNNKEPHVQDAFSNAIKENRFIAIKDGIEASKESRIKFVAVPLIANSSSIDYSSIEEVAESIGKGLKRDDIVCFNTSLPPGTTENIILPKLICHNTFKPDEDFALIYNPERIYIGRAVKDIEENYPAIISGIGDNSKTIAKELYAIIAKKGVIVMSSIRAAELEKLMEGVYRDVNIALANELAKICSKLKIDFWEVREAANSQPFCNIHRAGIGVGGICIPIYPKFVLDSAKKVKEESNIIEDARMLNDNMPEYSANEAMQIVNGKNITILGLAFRGNVADARLSPSYNIIDELLKNGYNVTLHDPYVNEQAVPDNVRFTRDMEEAIRDADLIFIATDHDEYKELDEDYIRSININARIYDGRGIFANKGFKKIKGIGRI